MGKIYFKHRSLHKYTSGKGARKSGGKEHYRSSTGEEGYAAICAGGEGGERDGMRPLRPPCCTA